MEEGGDSAGGSFEDRLRAARSRQGMDVPPGQGPLRQEGSSLLGLGVRVVVELVSAVLVAGVIGLYLDRWLHTRPALLIVFIVLGGAAGVLTVWRQLKSTMR